MATRSLIGTQVNGEIANIIYCHWDGYPDHVGQLLVEHYNTPTTVAELLELGDLSTLGKTTDESVAYHRDKKEPKWMTESRDVKINELETVASDYGVDYVYIFNDKFEWDCYKVGYEPRTLTPLTIIADVA